MHAARRVVVDVERVLDMERVLQPEHVFGSALMPALGYVRPESSGLTCSLRFAAGASPSVHMQAPS